MLPAFPGIIAWGLVTGVAMVRSGLDVGTALTISLIVYAGSAQLATLPLMIAAAPAWVIGLTALLTNLRFVIYGAAIRRWLADYPVGYRACIGYLTGDFSFVLFMNRVTREGTFPHRDAWLLGMTTLNWAAWQGASIVGIVAAAFVPETWGLEFAGTLALLALVIPFFRHIPGAAGGLTAGAVALAGHEWPFRMGLFVGVMAGIAVAMWLDPAATRQSFNEVDA
jgi:predicted branched-subunit amino acid permease